MKTRITSQGHKSPRRRTRSVEARQLVESLMGAGWSVDKIAEHARVSRRTVYRWKGGKSPYPLSMESLRSVAERA